MLQRPAIPWSLATLVAAELGISLAEILTQTVDSSPRTWGIAEPNSNRLIRRVGSASHDGLVSAIPL